MQISHEMKLQHIALSSLTASMSFRRQEHEDLGWSKIIIDGIYRRTEANNIPMKRESSIRCPQFRTVVAPLAIAHIDENKDENEKQRPWPEGHFEGLFEGRQTSNGKEILAQQELVKMMKMTPWAAEPLRNGSVRGGPQMPTFQEDPPPADQDRVYNLKMPGSGQDNFWPLRDDVSMPDVCPVFVKLR
ncbi:hypothetical protein MMC07_001464 [Pseudocyphellaria aurata]|nr:hypothetical protein [Pseudocyphellaria aurata]